MKIHREVFEHWLFSQPDERTFRNFINKLNKKKQRLTPCSPPERMWEDKNLVKLNKFMHYKNGRKAEIGDPVIGMTYNKTTPQIGIVVSLTPNQATCNCALSIHNQKLNEPGAFWKNEKDYSQCGWLLHIDDVWQFVIAICWSKDSQDHFAKIQNFRAKWNPTIKPQTEG